jgi:hypothetical protein
MNLHLQGKLAVRLLAHSAVFFGLVNPQMAHGAWPVKQFEIFLGRPNQLKSPGGIAVVQAAAKLGVQVDEELTPPTPISPTLIAELESYLAEVAQKYEKMRFDPPDIEPIVKRSDGRQAYRIYLFAFTGSGHPSRMYYKYDCAGDVRRTISIDITTFIRNGKLTPLGYQNLAHELFHAVQLGQPLYRNRANCSLGDWITEGTADALGVDMARELRGIDLPNRSDAWAQQRWGLRSYRRPLWVGDDDPDRTQDAYATSSFWRYLGEHAALGGSPGVAFTPPDYSYLADFFRRDLGGAPSQQVEIRWLHEALMGHERFKLGLDRIYPNFVNVFAAFPSNRIHPDGYTAAKGQEWWLSKLFPSCPVIKLSPALPKATERADLFQTGSWCAVLDLYYPGTIDVAVHASGVSGDAMKAITLGVTEGSIVAKPAIARAREVSFKDRAFWLPHLNGSGRHLLILSNVAAAPERSHRMSVTLEFSVGDLYNTMLPQSFNSAGAGPAAPVPAANPKGLTPASKPPGQSKPAGPAPAPANAVTLNTLADRRGQQIRQGMDGLTPHLAMAGNVSRMPQEPPCKDAFKFEPCGPTTSISSSIVPAIAPNLEASAGRGGIFGQFMTLMAGYGSAGVMGSSSALWATGQKSYDLDGSSVTITVPLIDYGFTGTFNNAVLRVHRSGGGMYEAIGPNDALPGPGALYPLSGRVTIEEYSPAILKGNFRGALVDTLKLEITGEDMTLPVHTEIEGSFSVVAPWRSDGRVERELAEEPEESVLRDMIGMFPGQQAQIEDALKRAKAGRAASAASTGPNTGRSVRAGCDCSCNAAPTASPACKQFCAPTYEACLGRQAGPVASNVPAPPPAEVPAGAAEAAALRGQFVGLLEQVYPGPALQSVREQVLQGFDGLKTMGEKQTIFDALRAKRRR